MSILRPLNTMAKRGAIMLVAVGGGALSGCSSASLTQSLSNSPTEMGGLSPDAPARSASPIAYPAVHDMPPARSSTVLTPQEQSKAEADLAATRERQAKRAGASSKDD